MKSPTIGIQTRSSPTLQNAIQEVLKLQASLIATRDTASAEDGFLISVFDEKELRRLIEKGGKLFTAHFQNKFAGYLLVSNISEFTELLNEKGEHSSGGKFIPTEPLQYENFDYLYQIAVARDMAGRSVGLNLLKKVQTETNRGLLTDVLISPIANNVSLRFFKKNGFQATGILKLAGYRTFGTLRSQVFTWKP
jgi:ribosomal protein S18 acetylase RimI-like enzyme